MGLARSDASPPSLSLIPEPMESPREKVKGYGGKTLRRFMKGELTHPPDRLLRVRIVSKPQPDGREHIGTEDSPQPKAEGSDDVNNIEGNGARCGIYISRRSRGVDFSTSGVDSVEVVIDVNSELLSRESYLFHELFGEMEIESQGEPLTIQIEASEENAFVGLLKYIYFSRMPPQSYEETVDLLMTSDEFQVLSCAHECIRRLVCKLNFSFSCFELFHKLHCTSIREFLEKKATDYVTPAITKRMMIPRNKYRCTTRIENELRQLPFSVIKSVFCMNHLEVESEDAVYDFILYWAQIHYPKPEDHCTAKELHLERLIRFPYLTHRKLGEALQCDFFYPESISKAVIEVLLPKVGVPYHDGLASQCSSSNLCRVKRHYWGARTPVVVTRLRFPEFDRCNVYFSFTKNELWNMFYWNSTMQCEDFQFGHQLFSLVASWNKVGRETCSGLSITAKAEILDDVVYATRFLAMREENDRPEYFEIGRGTLIPANRDNAGSNNLFRECWSELFCGTSPYTTGGFLHLCVEITCKRGGGGTFSLLN